MDNYGSMYNKRTWINPPESSYTGSIVACCYDLEYEGKIIKDAF